MIQDRAKEIAAELRCAVEKIMWATKTLSAEGYTVKFDCVSKDGTGHALLPADQLSEVTNVRIFKTITENL